MKKTALTRQDRTEYISTLRVTALFLILALIFGAVAYVFIGRYEDGVAELYADEQDEYVNMVRRQLQLHQDDLTAALMADTVGTLDNSDDRYWTLDDSRFLVFVKNVNETNEYKNFTSETFYDSPEARDFLGGLEEGRTRHAMITAGGISYIASGTILPYEGTDFRLCLLTDRKILMENNAYLSNKIYLGIAIGVLLAVLVLSAIWFALRINRMADHLNQARQDQEDLRRNIEVLNTSLSNHDAARGLLTADQLPALFAGLDADPSIGPVTLALVMPDEVTAADFINRARPTLSPAAVWARTDRDQALVILAGSRADQDLEALRRACSRKHVFMQTAAAEKGQPLRQAFAALREAAEAAQESQPAPSPQ